MSCESLRWAVRDVLTEVSCELTEWLCVSVWELCVLYVTAVRETEVRCECQCELKSAVRDELRESEMSCERWVDRGELWVDRVIVREYVRAVRTVSDSCAWDWGELYECQCELKSAVRDALRESSAVSCEVTCELIEWLCVSMWELWVLYVTAVRETEVSCVSVNVSLNQLSE